MENLMENTKNWIRQLPQKKQYLELVSAVLSVPVLVTVILLNVNNLSSQKNPKASPTPAASAAGPTVTIIREEKLVTPPPESPTPTPATGVTPSTPSCKKEVGPVTIDSPQENQVITGDSVSVDISAQSSDYCPVVWSYSLDGGKTSDYSSKNIVLYNLAPGNHIVNVNVKSTASDSEITLRRTFYFGNPNMQPTLTPTQGASSSAGTP